MMASSFARVMDENKDGVITREEFQQLLPGGSMHGAETRGRLPKNSFVPVSIGTWLRKGA
jgi:hypothetical protein